MKSRRLALLVAIALSGGGFLSSAQNVSAADVTGRNVTIDDTHAPSDNAIHPGGGPSIGTAAGFIQDEHDNGNVTNNTLTFKNRHYTNRLYGGLTFGKGNVTGNKVFVNSATSPLVSNADSIYGGVANGGGNVEANHATFDGNQLNGELVGGMATDGGTGTVKKNTATLKGGNVTGSIYGGTTGNQANGDVLENEVLIEGGATTTVAGSVYGGYSDGDGNVKSNIVTIKGGILNGIYGSYSSGTGEVSGNIVNLGDGTSTMAAGYAINGTIYGGRNDSHPDKVSNNTLNVNANAVAHNIKNFETINFNYNTHMDTTASLLKLTDSGKTKIKNLSQLRVNGGLLGSGTLVENANGIDIESYTAAVSRTGEKTETIIDKDGTTKIGYKGYQFKGARASQTEGTDIWGGRSVLGNTTTDNEITLSGNHTGKKAYGGWTSGTGSTATGENAQNHSIGNKITLTGATSEVYHMTGGATNIAGGNATGNHAILSDGRVAGNLTGGNATNGEVSGNTVEINGGRVDGVTYGGITGGAGTAKDNKVTLTNGTVYSDIFGGVATNGAATENKINITGGSAANHDVYGGFSTHGDATGNTVNITGGSVRNVDGGRSLNGNATGNTVNIGSTDAAFAGSITGIINGGSGIGFGKDYRTGNKLNVYGNATASNIRNFAEINFHFNSHVNQSASFLTLNDGGGTTIESLGDLNVDGEHGRKGVLLQNTPGSITITDGQNRRIKTSDDKELILEKSTDNKKITYEGYRFANATEPTTVTESGVTSTWGGRSVVGNSTRKNVITVTSGTHTNIYGGWTAGSGTTADDKDNSYKNEVTLDGSSTTTDNLYGGYVDTDAGNAEENTVTVKNGTVTTAVYGGTTNKVAGTGYVKKNIVNISGGTVSNVYGGYSAGSGEVSGNTVTATGGTGFNDVRGGYATTGAANKNIVNLGAVSTGAVTGGRGATTADGNEITLTGTTATSVTGGEGATTNNNIVNLNGDVTVNNALTGGTAASGTGNTLNVKGKNVAGTISGFQKLHFDTTGATATNPLLNITGGATNLDWNTLDASGTSVNRVSLLKNAAGINLTNHTPGTVKSKINEAGTTEYNIDVAETSGTITDITYQGYQFKGKTTATTEGTDTYGGRSKAGNTTTGNERTVDSGSHTNIYGGWTSGTGTTAALDKQKNSINNKVTVKGTAAATGSVISGLTDVAGGKATGNTVTVEKDLAANIIGGKAASGEASGNTVNLANATVNSITGGDGTTTNNNTVNLNGSTEVTGALKGGTAANGTGNTLNVKGKDNKAGAIANIQKMNFDATGLAKNDTMLEVTGRAQTDVNWADLSATGTAAKPLTLLRNANGINLTGYTGAVKSETTETTETNIDVVKDSSNKITEITYEGYQFKGVMTATSDGGNLYGGISKAGNSTRENTITVNSGSHTNVYGGHTSGSGTGEADKNNSYNNTVTIAGGTVTGKLYGGYTEVADGKTYNNAVNLNGGNLSNAEISGGNRTIGMEKGNTLNVNTAVTVKKIDNFQAVTFKDKDAKLTLTGMGVKFDLAAVKAGFDAAAQEQTLVESSNALDLTGDTFHSDLSADGTKETNIEAREGNKKIVRYGYTLKNATTATTVGSDTWGGRSKASNTTTGNALTLMAGAHTNVYGGWTSGSGSDAPADQQKNSTKNTVMVKNSATVSGTVYGGFTDVTGGKATGNTVTVEKNLDADLVGGKAAAEASGNTVNVTNATVKSITGGFGTVTNDNRINLRDVKVTGMVTGGTAANGTGNTLAVSYGMKTTEIGDFRGIQNLHFDMEKAPMDGTAHTMLKLTNVGGEKKLSNAHIDLHRDGAAEKLKVGDKITLMENTSGGITFGENLTAKGTDGVTRDYEFAIASVDKTLIATVTKAGMGEQAKSFVETRAGASAFLNDGADFTAGPGMDAAKKEARAAAQSGSAPYGIWAGMGGGSLRHETGSYVDMKGWNLGVGWARENAVQAGTLTFGPFIEYGRGSYDSYLDDGTHGSGKTSFLGAGVMAKIETDSHWVDGSLRVGRTKSDYTGRASYDTTSTYYGVQIGAGKDLHVSENDTVGAYVRYAYAHTAGTSAHMSSGETFDFDAVNSHRLRLGTRYTHGMTALSQFYAGLAWEYEFDGDARATSQGDSAPSPSLKGGSALLELGYRFAPQGSRLSYDLNLTGWQGKRQGITGGLSVKWAF